MKYLLALVPALAFTACMDFDTPGDEFTGNQIKVDENVYVGRPDSIPYDFVPESEDVCWEKLDKLGVMLSQMPTGQYYLRGSKDGAITSTHAYQYCYNLHIDNYAGFWTLSQNFNGNMMTAYSYFREYCDGPYGHYKEVRNNICNTLNFTAIDTFPEIKAVALLIFDYASQEMVDVYGSVPYTDLKHNKQSAPFTFEPGSEIYRKVIDNIDTIDLCFKTFETKPQWYKDFIQQMVLPVCDGITQDKTIASWRRMANSLKLRMAMHCVKIWPDDARKWAEEAVQAGVVTTPEQEIVLNENTMMFSPPFIELCNSWNDAKLCASFESLLKSLDHPFMKYVWAKNSRAITDIYTGELTPANHDIYGMRTGVVTYNGNGAAYEANPYLTFSCVNTDNWDIDPVFYSAMNCAPLYFFKVSELEFLRAEGALRGWNMGGDVRTLYEQGIRHAQVESRLMAEKQHYNKYVEDYMQVEKAKPFTYHDPLNSRNDIASVTTIGVKWNDSDNMETKLEKIITQKYISLFPYGNEAWAEVRRTGYPKLLPPLNTEDYTDGTYSDPNEIMRRILLPGGGTSEGDADILNTGIPALEADGGFGDYQYSPVFWDVTAGNF